MAMKVTQYLLYAVRAVDLRSMVRLHVRAMVLWAALLVLLQAPGLEWNSPEGHAPGREECRGRAMQ